MSTRLRRWGRRGGRGLGDVLHAIELPPDVSRRRRIRAGLLFSVGRDTAPWKWRSTAVLSRARARSQLLPRVFGAFGDLLLSCQPQQDVVRRLLAADGHVGAAIVGAFAFGGEWLGARRLRSFALDSLSVDTGSTFRA